MKRIMALVLALVTLFSCSIAFAVTHYGNNDATAKEGFFALLNNEGLVVGTLSLDEFVGQIKSGNLAPVQMDDGFNTIKGILSNGRLLRCKNLKHVQMNEEKTKITAGESYVYATYEIKNQAILDSLGLSSLSEIIEATKVSVTIYGKDYAAHRFVGSDVGTEVIEASTPDGYFSIRYADWDDGVKNNNVLCLRAGSRGNTSQPPAEKPTQAPSQAPTTKPTQAPTQAPTTKPTQAPTTKPTQAPANTPNPEYQPVVTPPTLDWSDDSSAPETPSPSSTNAPNPEYQDTILPGDLGDFWN